MLYTTLSQQTHAPVLSTLIITIAIKQAADVFPSTGLNGMGVTVH